MRAGEVDRWPPREEGWKSVCTWEGGAPAGIESSSSFLLSGVSAIIHQEQNEAYRRYGWQCHRK